MKKDPSVFLKHILECIDLIEKYSNWNIVENDLPQLKEQVESMLKDNS